MIIKNDNCFSYFQSIIELNQYVFPNLLSQTLLIPSRASSATLFNPLLISGVNNTRKPFKQISARYSISVSFGPFGRKKISSTAVTMSF